LLLLRAVLRTGGLGFTTAADAVAAYDFRVRCLPPSLAIPAYAIVIIVSALHRFIAPAEVSALANAGTIACIRADARRISRRFIFAYLISSEATPAVLHTGAVAEALVQVLLRRGRK